jgi:ABC-2 type transport system ATP-binding protein
MSATAPTTNPIRVEAAGLAKEFPGVRAVDGVGFAIEAGEIFGLVGPDGAGKTTVMRMLAGVLPPDRGRILIDDVDVVAEPERAKQHLSYMPQRFGLYEDLTVEENIRFYADLFGIGRNLREERVGPLLAASNMENFRRRLAGQLSGGMKQKLGLICALIHTPRVLLLDEPTTGVDPVSRRDFWRILYSLRESGATIVISTAYLDEAERCTRLGLLHHGQVAYCDTPSRLKQRMPGVLITIATPNPRALRDAVARLPAVKSVLLVGDGIRAVIDSSQSIPALRAELSGQAVDFGSVLPAEPSIEDLFVALLSDRAES